MSWKDNRRRRRVWYLRYKSLCEDVRQLIDSGRQIAAEEFVNMVFRENERRRLHGKRRIANSAYESMMLAARDSGLMDTALMPVRYSAGERVRVEGGFAEAKPERIENKGIPF